MRRGVLAKWLFELVALYLGWGLLDYAKGLFLSIYASNPLTLNTTVFGTVGILAIIAAAVLGTLLVQDVAKWAGRRGKREFQTFLGGDELLKELEDVQAWCDRFRNAVVSAQDVSPTIVELNHLSNTLTELKNKYRGGSWNLSRENKVTMVADQLRQASSALSKRLLEETKGHVEDARLMAASFIGELKAPPSS
jgi:hypothetical protein